MKKNLAVLTAVLTIAVSGIFAADIKADVIMEVFPIGFSDEHSEECTFIENRNYTIINDCDGYDMPCGNIVSALKKDDIVSIFVNYTDSEGRLWGRYDIAGGFHMKGEETWLLMENAELKYDSLSFRSEYNDRLEMYGGILDGFEPEQQVVLWTYPNSGEIDHIIVSPNWKKRGYSNMGEYALWQFTDDCGRTWVEFMDCWICAGYPEAEVIPEEIMPEPVSESVMTEAVQTADTIASETSAEVSEKVTESESFSETKIVSDSITETESLSEGIGETVSSSVSSLIEETVTSAESISEAVEPETKASSRHSSAALPILLAGCAAGVSAALIKFLKKRG